MKENTLCLDRSFNSFTKKDQTSVISAKNQPIQNATQLASKVKAQLMLVGHSEIRLLILLQN